jgi:hypothetical protein
VLVVADAGPLIYLSAVGEIDLPRRVYGRVLVPTVVFDEVVVRGAGLVGSRELAAAKWIEVVSVDTSDPDVQPLLAVLDAG